MKKHEKVRGDLSPDGKRLLRLISNHVCLPSFIPGDPKTYLGYKGCCIALGIAPTHADLPWGRLLQQHGLNELNEWTKRHNLPRVTGLIVNQTGDRRYWPGGDYFQSNGRQDMDGTWWEDQAKQAAQTNWQFFL